MLNIDSYHFFGAPMAKNAGVHRKLRETVCRRTKRYLWVPEDAVTFKPALSNRIFGDGRALMGLSTMNQRPKFYILRVDSQWEIGTDMQAPDDAVEFAEYVDAICFALEDEFGRGGYDDGSGEKETARERNRRRAWPAFDDNGGCTWWRVNWPEKCGIKTVPHPFSPHYTILK